MKRREFITLLGGAAASWPLAVRAQQETIIYTIGVLTLSNPNPEQLLEALREGLRDAGYVDGRNLRLVVRSATGRPDLQLEKATELVRLKVDLIVTFFTPSALAAKEATPDIPIVMAGAGDPVATGLVASLARPGGNVTGGAELAGKSVELIRELIPAARRIGVLADETDPFAKPYVAQISEAARSALMEVEPIMIRPGQPPEAPFDILISERVDGLLIQGSIARKELLDLAIQHRLPALTSTRLGPPLGALMSYGSDYVALARQSAAYIDKILKGDQTG